MTYFRTTERPSAEYPSTVQQTAAEQYGVLMKLLDWSDLKYFSWEEFRDPGIMTHAFMKRLDRAREISGIPYKITSSREADHVDIRCWDSTARNLITRGIIEAGFTRIGLYSRHVHVDGNKQRVQNVLWLGGRSR